MRRLSSILFLALISSAPQDAPARAPKAKASGANPWVQVKTPAQGRTESIGGYASGCLRGAERMEDTGPGFQLMRLSRNRVFGHPRLLEFIRTLGRKSSAQGLGTLLVGDLGQPRGGPTLSLHASHQNGLDADLWLDLITDGSILSPQERESRDASTMVVPDFERLSASWNPAVIELLRLTASENEVERIFINPVIKKALCGKYKGEGWLAKVRPWWGHADHLHARLRCDARDPLCAPQEAVPAGDGCGAELADWFTPETKAKARELRAHPKPSTMPVLPAECREVILAP
ncbi:MAG: penicillin-insensitive murein endopeptidase [Elusimicrobiota bacterium]|jgi:penicillin-insensitive murein endopeptidase